MTRPIARAYRNIAETPKDSLAAESRPMRRMESRGLPEDRGDLGEWFVPNMDPLPDDWSMLFDDAGSHGEALQDLTRFYEIFDDIDNDHAHIEQTSQFA